MYSPLGFPGLYRDYYSNFLEHFFSFENYYSEHSSFSYFMPYISPRPFKSYFFQASTKLDALGKNIKVLDDGSFSLLMRKEIAFLKLRREGESFFAFVVINAYLICFSKKSARCGKMSVLMYFGWNCKSINILIHNWYNMFMYNNKNWSNICWKNLRYNFSCFEMTRF